MFDQCKRKCTIGIVWLPQLMIYFTRQNVEYEDDCDDDDNDDDEDNDDGGSDTNSVWGAVNLEEYRNIRMIFAHRRNGMC